MTVRTKERKQFLFDVFVAALEGGIGYWSQAHAYHIWVQRDDLGEESREDIDGFYAVVEDEERDYYENVHKIDIKVISRGIGLFVEWVRHTDTGPDSYARQFLKANDTNGVEGDYDSSIADMIVQFGLFGEVVYG